ncbi:MAG: hypothetical protein IT379_40915 [Deltaproteobacteria bacterium]|nr:hypothetical protein [Deltaproteobacteria bacterium]
MCAEHSLHAAILARARFEADEQVRVMGVTLSGGAPLFLYSRAAMRRARPRQIAAVLLHELGHLLLFHVVKPIGSFEHPGARRLAEEVSANAFVKGFPFPERPILLSDFGLPEGESTDVRYRKLVEMGHAGGAEVRTLDDHDVWERRCPVGALESAVWSANLMDAWEGAEGWDRFELPAEAPAVLGSIDRGSAPGDRIETLPDGDAEGIGRALCSAVERLTGGRCELRESRTRPARRALAGSVTYPGLVVRPTEPHVAVIVDTSGSTAQFAYETASALAALADRAKVTMIQCDCRVQSVERLRWPLPPIRGRGGSDLRPAFHELEKLRCDAVVVITDLVTGLPAVAPSIPVLFVVTPDAPPAPWGRYLRLPARWRAPAG